MKTAINAWSIDGKVFFEDMFRQVKAAGFDGIELNIDNAGTSAHSLTLDTTAEELKSIISLSKQFSLPVVSISTSLYGMHMGSRNLAENEKAGEILKKQLECAKALRASGILVVPGGISEDVSIEEAYKISAKTLESNRSVIEAYEIYVGLENVWNQFFMSPYDMRNFIDRLKCPYITAYYDPGNVAAFSWPEYWISILGNRITHFHIKDFKRNSGWGSGFNCGGDFVELCTGSVPFKKVIYALREIGFDGYLTAEVDKKDAYQSYEDFYKMTCDTIREIIAL